MSIQVKFDIFQASKPDRKNVYSLCFVEFICSVDRIIISFFSFARPSHNSNFKMENDSVLVALNGVSMSDVVHSNNNSIYSAEHGFVWLLCAKSMHVGWARN